MAALYDFGAQHVQIVSGSLCYIPAGLCLSQFAWYPHLPLVLQMPLSVYCAIEELDL